MMFKELKGKKAAAPQHNSSGGRGRQRDQKVMKYCFRGFGHLFPYFQFLWGRGGLGM